MLCDLLIYQRSWLDRLHRHSLFPTNVTTPISSMLLSSSCCFSSRFLVHYSYSLSFPFSLSFFFHVLDTRHSHGSVFPITVWKTTRIVCAMEDRFSHHLPLTIGLIPPGAAQRSGAYRDAASTLCSCLSLLTRGINLCSKSKSVGSCVFLFSLFSFLYFVVDNFVSSLPPFCSQRNLGGQVPLCFERANKYDTKPTINAFNDHATGVSATGRKGIHRWRR